MTKFKKITSVLTVTLLSIGVLLFCLLFTAPGNHFIAYSANKLVDGLEIKLPSGRFLYNDPFDVRYENQAIKLDAKQLKVDLFWWGCNGICLDNISAQNIDVNVKSQQAVADQQPQPAQEQLQQDTAPSGEQITLPLKVTVKRVAINQLTLTHPSADVTVEKLNLSAVAELSDILVDALKINTVTVQLHDVKEQPKSQPLTVLPALPTLDLTLPLNIQLNTLNISKVAVTPVAAERAEVINNIALSATAKGHEVRVEKLDAQYNDWQLNTDLFAELNAHNSVRGHVALTHPNHQLKLDLTGTLADLNVTLLTQGQYPLNVDAQVNLQKDNFPFSLTGRVDKWSLDAGAEQLNLSKLDLHGQGHANDYKVKVDLISQLGAYPQVSISSQLQGSLTGAKLEQLKLNANESQAIIHASVDWSKGVNTEFNGKLEHLKAQYLTDAMSSDLSGGFKGSFGLTGTDWQLAVENTTINGTVNDVPVSLESDFKLDSSLHASFDKLQLKSGSNELALSGQVDESWRVDGKLRLDAAEQEILPMQGKGNADLVIRGERLAPVVDLNLALNTLSYQDLQIDGLTLKGQFDYAADWQTDISLILDSANIADNKINQVELNVTGDKVDHHLRLLLDADQGKASLDINGQLKKDKWQGSLSNILITDNHIRLTTDKAIKANVDINTLDFHIADHCWQSASSKLCVNTLQQTKQLGQLNAQLAALSLPEFNRFIPENIKVSGSANGEFVANWADGALKTLRANMSTSELAATLIDDASVYKLPIEALNLSAMSDASIGKLEATLDSSVLGKVTSHINIDDIQANQNLSGELEIEKILLTNIQPFIGSLEQLTGEIKGKLNVAGTLKEPLLNGELNIEQVNLDGATLPVSLQDSHVDIAFNNQSAEITGKLKDAEGGSLNLSGDIDWQAELPDVNVKLQGNEFFVRAQQDVTFKVSPEITMSLKNRAFNLDGQVVVPWGRIEIEELPEGAVQVSDDEVIVDIEQQQTEKAPFDYAINLKLLVENDVRIDSFGLKSKVAGDINISMDQTTPMIATGELNLIEGTYRAFGQDLQIRTGQVGFSGSIDKPYLNIKAIRNPENTSNGVIAGITLTGNVEQPSLKVYSEPAMDQAQALAYLLNGQPLDEGDSSTDAMLTQLLLAQGVNRSEGVVSKIGESFGLSDVSLSSKGSGDDTKVEISGYLTPGIQVKYSVGIFDSLSEVAVRYQLLSQLYIEVTSGLYQNVDILYKFDWD